MEFFSVRHGRREDPGGKVFYDSDGFGLSFSGVIKLARILNSELESNPILTFLGQHLDIQYNSSSFDAGVGSPLDSTKFRGIRISLF